MSYGAFGQQGQWGGPQQGQGQSSFGGWGGYQQPGPQYGGPRPQPSAPQYGGAPQGGPQYGGPPQGGPQFGAPQFGGQGQPAYGRPPQGGPQYGGPQFQPFPQGPRKKSTPWGIYSVISVLTIALVAVLGVAVLGGDDPITGPDYQNEDYTVPEEMSQQPPLPEPSSDAESQEWLENNAWYSVELATPIRCELPGSSDPNDDDIQQLQARTDALLECLTRAVGPSLEEQGFTPIMPKMVVYEPGTEVNTQCGTQPSMTAFYCSGDQGIYLAPDVREALAEPEINANYLFDYIIAHEYAHALQGRTGIFVAAAMDMYYAESDADAMLVSRRMEFQADCWSQMMLTSVRDDMGISDEDFQGLWDAAYAIGDDQVAERFGYDIDPSEYSHGTGANRGKWAEAGALQHNPGTCNTFTQPAEEMN